MAVVAVLLVLSLSFRYRRLSKEIHPTICHLNKSDIKTISQRQIKNCSQLSAPSNTSKRFFSFNRFPYRYIESISFQPKLGGRWVSKLFVNQLFEDISLASWNVEIPFIEFNHFLSCFMLQGFKDFLSERGDFTIIYRS